MARAQAMESDCFSTSSSYSKQSYALAMAKFSNNPLLSSRSDELQENKTDDEDSLSSATLR